MIKNTHILFLFFIIILASFLRLYDLSNVPPSPSLDEVSIGYNAYSILKTGKDEYGTSFPVLLRAYDDYRPALYVYLVIPFIKLFGLNVLAVRLPAVILSILTVVASYFLTKTLFINRGITQNRTQNQAESIGLLTSFIMAISPWHIYLSRLGHEVNAGLAFFIFGFLFFLKAVNIRKKHIFLTLSSIFFALSLTSYQAEKIFIPIFIVLLIWIFIKELRLIRKQAIIAFIIGVIIITPFLQATFSPNALIRFEATSVLKASSDRFSKEASELAKSIKNNDFLGRVIHNRRVVTAKILSENYISHFNLIWLFTNPTEDKHKVPGVGLFYLWEFPLLILGLIFLFSGKFDKRIRILLLFWILISPVGSSITTDAPHAMRSFTVLPAPMIIASLGIIWIYYFLKRYNIALLSILAIIITISLVYLFKQYFYIFPKSQSKSFQYALAKTIPFVLAKDDKYQHVIFSNTDNLYQSYMFFLFFSKYDPILYQKQGGTKSGGFRETHKFGKYEVRPITWDKDSQINNTLIIGNPQEFPSSVESIFEGRYLDGIIGTKVVRL